MSCELSRVGHTLRDFSPMSLIPDRYNYVSTSRIKVHVVPINGITNNQFSRYFNALKSVCEIRLLDVTPMADLKYFNPQSTPNGHLLYDFSSSTPESESIFLHDFEPYRKTFIVLGIGSFNSSNPDVGSQLKKLYPTTIVQNAIYFDTPTDQINQLSPANDHSMRDVFYTGSPDNTSTSLETIMCEISRNFLYHLDGYASSYANITLRSPMAINDSQLLTKTINKAQKRISSGLASLKVSFNGNGPISGQIDSKNKSQVRNTGRHSKLMASFYLLAGKYMDAMNNFTDALLYLRKSDDSMWLASALEGIAVAIVLLNYTQSSYQLPNAVLTSVLLLSKGKIRDMSIDNAARKISSDSAVDVRRSSSAAVSSPRTSFSSLSSTLGGPGPDLSMIAVPELIRQIHNKVNFFFHSSTDDIENTVPDIVYIESLMRQISFMAIVFNHGLAINHQFYDTLVTGTPPTQINFSHNPWFTKSDILNEIDKIFSLQLIDLSLVDQCRIYCSVASTYDQLKMYRKKAFMLRTLLVGLLPKLELLETGDNDDANETRANDDGVKEVIKLLLFEYSIKQEKTTSDVTWNSIQLLLVRIAIRIVESLKDYEFLVEIYVLTLTKFLHCLTTDDQLKLKQKLESICLSSPNIVVHHCDPFLVRSIQFIGGTHKEKLLPFQKQQPVTNDSGPLIFNPFNKPTGPPLNTDNLLIKDQIYLLKVTFQNPFAYELDLNDIQIISDDEFPIETIHSGVRPVNESMIKNSPLKTQSKLTINNPKLRSERALGTYSSPKLNGMETSNGQFNPSSNLTVIQPNSLEVFIVPFKPLKSGKLVISGMRIAVGKCTLQDFLLIDKEINVETIKHKQRPELEMTEKPINQFDIGTRVTTSKLELDVIDPQPSLSLLEMLITNGWLMLLEGEEYEFLVELENRSLQTINSLSFSFWDSTIQSLTNKLNSSTVGSQLSALEIHELEWYLLKFKSFVILNKKEIAEKYKTIRPYEAIKIDYKITGKRHMTDLRIILEYANKDESKPSFIKSIEVPLNLTVVPSIDLISFDIIPLFASTLDGFKNVSVEGADLQNLDELKQFVTRVVKEKGHSITDYCLLIIDLRNSWTDDLNVDVKFKSDVDETFKLKDVLKPRRAKRYLIPTRRIAFKDTKLHDRIPSLRNKQYIKDYLISEAEDLDMRQCYWLREKLLDRISGKWNGSDRKGILSFRNMKLSNKMATSLLYPRIRVVLDILNDDLSPVQRDGYLLSLKTECFYIMRTTITNYSDSEISGILRHLPYPLINGSIQSSVQFTRDQMNIDKRILYNGLLQSKLPKTIAPDQSLNVDLSFVILERGEYEWGALVDTTSENNEAFKITSREPVYISAS